MNEVNLFGWFKKDTTFSTEQVQSLVEKIKQFNAGAIDAYLTEHVDRTFAEWLSEQKEKS